METVVRKPEWIVSVELVQPLSVTPLVVVDFHRSFTAELSLHRGFDLSRWNALDGRELGWRPGLCAFDVAAGILAFTGERQRERKNAESATNESARIVDYGHEASGIVLVRLRT